MTYTKNDIPQLRALADERLEWAKQARERDLHGSAKEYSLTATLAFQLATMLEQGETQ